MQYVSFLLTLLVASGVADISGMSVVQTVHGPMVMADLAPDILVKDGTGAYTRIELSDKVGPTDVIRIQTETTSIEVTPDHIMTLDRPRSASALQVGDMLLVNAEWEVIIRIVKDLAVETVKVSTGSGTINIDGIAVPTHTLCCYWTILRKYLGW